MQPVLYIDHFPSVMLPRLVSSLEKKLQAAQASYDTFEDVRTRLGDVSRTPETLGLYRFNTAAKPTAFTTHCHGVEQGYKFINSY